MPTKIALRPPILSMVAVALLLLCPRARADIPKPAGDPAPALNLASPAVQVFAKYPLMAKADSPPQDKAKPAASKPKPKPASKDAPQEKNHAQEKKAVPAASSSPPAPPDKASSKSKASVKAKDKDKDKDTDRSTGESRPRALPGHHHLYSLNHVSASQLYGYRGSHAALAVQYRKNTFYSFTGNAAFKDDTFGPDMEGQIIHRESELPIVLGLSFGLGREQGSSRTPAQQGPIARHTDATAFSLTYLYQPGLSLALHYSSHSQKTKGGFYSYTYFFAWQEYKLAALYYTRLWEAGLQWRPGLLKVSYYQDDNESVSLAVPSQLSAHASYRIAGALTVFTKLDLLLGSRLNHGFDAAWANQIQVTGGASYTARLAVFELALSMASDGFRDITASSARRVGQNKIAANVIRPISERTTLGATLNLASNDSSLRKDDQDWVLTANQRSLSLFVSWQPTQPTRDH